MNSKLSDFQFLVRALDFAANKHRDQRRKDEFATPYINHPISVMKILSNEANIEDKYVLSAALLHDTIEDTNTTYSDIVNEFGLPVASIVLEVTDDKSLPRDVRKQKQIEHASTLSLEASLVKIADKIANLRDLKHFPPVKWTEERRLDYFSWAQKVVSNIKSPHPVLLKLFQASLIPELKTEPPENLIRLKKIKKV